MVSLVASAVLIFRICQLLVQCAVSIPLWDDWEMAPLITAVRQGEIPWTGLLAQQQEARTLFPKLVFILASLGSPLDVRVVIALSVVSCILTAAGIFWLLRKSELSVVMRSVCFFLSVVAIFSPRQHEVWVLGFGFPSFVIGFWLVAALVLMRTHFSFGGKFVGCLILTLLSSFTLAHGLLAWGLTFPVLLLIERPRTWIWWAAGWAALCVACAVVYFHGYGKPPDVPAFAPSVPPLRYVQYAFVFLGAGLARDVKEVDVLPATAAGVVLLLVYIGAAFYSWRRRRDAKFVQRVLPWFALGMFSIGSAGLAAMGRVEWGLPQALESRYVPFSLYLTVAVIALVPVIARELATPHRWAVLASWGILIAAFLLLHRAHWDTSIYWFERRGAAGHVGQAAVMFSQLVDGSGAIEKSVYPRPAFAVEQADLLDRASVLRPKLVRAVELSGMMAGTRKATGALESATKQDDGNYAVSGWAILPTPPRRADSVVLVSVAADGEPRLVAIADRPERRRDIMKQLRNRNGLWSGWHATVPPSAMVPGAEISAWAVDTAGRKLHRLPTNAFIVPP